MTYAKKARTPAAAARANEPLTIEALPVNGGLVPEGYEAPVPDGLPVPDGWLPPGDETGVGGDGVTVTTLVITVGMQVVIKVVLKVGVSPAAEEVAETSGVVSGPAGMDVGYGGITLEIG